MLREAPYITISEITFSDETTIKLHSNDIVVFVGPNNAGKSASLREIQSMLGRGGQKTQVITNIKPTKSGTIDELMNAFERYGHKSFLDGNLHYSGHNYNIPEGVIGPSWEGRLEFLRDFFCKRLKTESRLTDSNPKPSFKVLTEAASYPIQLDASKNLPIPAVF